MSDNTDPAAQKVAVTKSVRDTLAATSDPNHTQSSPGTDHIDVHDKIGNKVKTQVKVTGEMVFQSQLHP
jgi:hypothetical protein